MSGNLTNSPDELVQQAVQRLRNAFGPCMIYLFGSWATNRHGPWSDIDLLMVLPHSTESFYARTGRAYRALGDLPAPIDVQVYTRAEFDARASLPVSFERTVKDTGRVLHAA